jgi:hypothetical protein
MADDWTTASGAMIEDESPHLMLQRLDEQRFRVARRDGSTSRSAVVAHLMYCRALAELAVRGYEIEARDQQPIEM